MEYNSILDHEEAYWFQQSRSKWLRLGDRNTKYFHQTTLIRRRSNRIDALMNALGEWVYEELDVREILVNHYRELFNPEPIQRPPLLTFLPFL